MLAVAGATAALCALIGAVWAVCSATRDSFTPSEGRSMSVGADSAKDWRIGLVGYGEVGRIVAEDLRAAGVAQVAACDIKLGTAAEGPLVAHAAAHGVRLVAAHARLAAESDFVLSAVTASQAVAVAEACAPGHRAGDVVPRFQLGVAGGQDRRGAPRRRGRRALRRGRGDDVGAAVPDPGPAAPRRTRCGATRCRGWSSWASRRRWARRGSASRRRPRCAAA